LDDLLASLRDRLIAYDGGVAGPLLTDAALAEADALMQAAQAALAKGDTPSHVLYVLARFYWCRCLVLPDDGDQHDMLAAVVTLSLLPTPTSDRALAQFRQGLHRLSEAGSVQLAGRAANAFGQIDLQSPAAVSLAVDLFRLALRGMSTSPGHAATLSNLSEMLQARFELLGDPADLDEAVESGSNAVRCGSLDDPARANFLHNLSCARLKRFAARGDAHDLSEAVECSRAATVSVGGSDYRRPQMLCVLSGALRNRFEQFGDVHDIDEAIESGKAGARAAPVEDPARLTCLSTVGNAYTARFLAFGDPLDTHRAVDFGRAAVQAAEPTRPHYAGALNNLSVALHRRFERLGDLADINEAVESGRAAISATPSDSPSRLMHLSSTSTALLTRFQHIGERADLDQALALSQAAIDATPISSPNWSAVVSHHAIMLQTRFEQFDERTDIDEAVDRGRAAVESAPVIDRGMCLSNLGSALMKRFDKFGALTDIHEAIRTCRDAIDATPTGDTDTLARQTNHAAALQSRFDRLGELADLDQAIDAYRAAAHSTPHDDPGRAPVLANLGTALQSRFEHTQNRADIDSSIDVRKEATQLETAPAALRLAAADAWGAASASLGDWPTALEGHAAAVGLLPLLAWRGVSRSGREELLADWRGLAADAAACAIEAGQPDRAVELLEYGRGVLWSQLLDARTDLTTLHDVEPDLARRLDAARALLDVPATGFQPSNGNVDGAVWRTDQHMAAARRWDLLVEQVRQLPDFETFLQPPSITQLRRSAAGGPVAVVNTSRYRCDALIVTRADTHVVHLPNLTHAEASRRARTYLAALKSSESSEESITTTLEWLWDAVAEPILTALGYSRTPSDNQPWPRQWWCPTGPLTLLPLHAAGYHHPDHSRARRSVLDRVVSSYTPTLQALHAARTGERLVSSAETKGYRQYEAASRAGTTRTSLADVAASTSGQSVERSARLLLVALPHTPRQDALPGVDREREVLDRLFTHEQCTILSDHHATRTAILNALSNHQWVHASCHGTQDLAHPDEGGLVPYDWDQAGAGLVGITDISAHRTGGEFAFLSGCETALGGTSNPDEALNLAAALQYAGWRHVIATLCSVWDNASVFVTHTVYPLLVHEGHLDPGGAAEALHDAIRAYRDSDDHRLKPSRWAPFVHIGP
jgi:tetratricopeptide (TPR) repeat protein